ncbi:MAG: Lrp/AsnC family transcriptional regulator [Qipengyuania sp.]|nr:Lrp/AsnC family transcriptional regulator [Qipengyuania sp.]
MDRIDLSILRSLATDGRISVSRIAEQVALSQSACTRRIQALEARGLVRGYGARLDYQQLGFRVTALVDITLNTQVEEHLTHFEAAVSKIDGIIECALVSGTQDYRLKIVCRDLDHYERLHRESLGRLPGLHSINSSFVLRSIETRGETDALFSQY